MSDEQNQDQQGQEQTQNHASKQSEEKREYTPPALHAVDMRKDRYGLDYPVTIGAAWPDKRGHGQLMKMRADMVSGFHNIMTDKELKKSQADHQQARWEHENRSRSRFD
jgi:hypothetical protein